MTTIRTPLPGYNLVELLHESSRTLVYRGIHLADNNTVIIKLLNCKYPTFNELVNFRNQYTIVKNLDLPGIVKPLNLEHYGNGLALVMEDFGGISLAEYIARRPLSLEEFLLSAIALCQILEGLYRNRVIHKDIKPSNIIINPDSKQIKLTDFSISSLLPRETQVLQSPNILEGTLAYISPEQTGRMNRGIDYRSDFYSLGVTFYQLLTGQLPFGSDDPMELVHCHIAKIPTPPRTIKNDIPQVLSDLVIKLMAKTAEQRYQSVLGLKSDLEKCLSRWQETGKIEPFELGKRDISDRFLIPEKLYGREPEVRTLLEAFHRAASSFCEMMLVAGFSGIGKTAVINEVHKPIVRQRGYFIKGKFDQFQRNIPFSAFVQAFRDLMGQLLAEGDTQLESWKTKILTALGENGQVIIEVIPELEQIIGQQPPVPELSGSAAQNRFNLLFAKFIQVFTTPNHPLVIFIDDLQWADSASLKLMQLLIGDSQMGYLLLLGAYRDNEVFSAHPLILTLDELVKLGATINSITLAPLSQGDLNCWVADTLSCELQLASPLTELVYQKTEGNPFFASQFLKGLHEDGWIAFNLDLGYWQCDLAGVRQLALTDDVVAFMATRLYNLPEKTQEVLKLAACIGNQFDLVTLAIVCEQPVVAVATALWEALQEGFVLPVSDTYKFFQEIDYREQEFSEKVSVSYKFLHDRVQQAAYVLIPDGSQQEIYLKIGQLLLHSIPKSQQEERIFEIVDPLNLAVDIIVDPVLKEELIGLNLRAGRHAKAVTAHEAAFRYLQSAIDLLSAEAWQRNYVKTLEVYNLGVEVAYLSGCFSHMESWTKLVLSNATSIYDRITVTRIKLQALSGGEQGAVVREALDILAELEIFLPGKPTPAELQQAREIAEKMLAQQPISSLVDLPPMNNRHFLAVAAILQASLPTIYRLEPDLFQLMVLKLIQLSLEHGNTSLSSFGYACYALMCCSDPQIINLGYEIAQMALAVAEKMSDRSLQARTLFVVSVFVHVWKLPLDNVLEELQRAYQICLDAGDLEFVGHTALHYCYTAFFSSQHLQSLKSKVYSYFKALQKFGQDVCANYIKPYQITIKLLTNSQNLDFSVKEFQSELSQQQALFEEANDRYGLFTCHFNGLIVHYWFGNFQQAQTNAHLACEYLNAVAGDFIIAIFYFYAALTRLQLYPQQNMKEQSTSLAKVVADREALLNFARHAPTNYQHKYDLLQAEYYRILGEKLEAIEYYERAISGAKENGYTQEESLANELAAKFYRDWGKEKIASTYMQEAYYSYARWGAKAKVEDLEKRYPALLSPILEQQKLSLRPSATIASWSRGTISKTTTGTGELLDLATLMKASRTLSGNIELEGAITNLIQVARENAGAETVALMLLKERGLMLTAKVNNEEIIKLNFVPVENSNAVPLSIVNQVKHSRQPLLLENASQESAFAGDTYIQQYQPLSILCLPLVDRGQLIGILYLENNQCMGAFTGDRLEVLNLLCSQAAISLENAQLYQQSQQALRDLQQAQLQLVQSEKMATLGNLVAGVGHEINNPIGFISGNINAAQRHLQDLLSALALYQQKYPDSEADLAEDLAELELDFIAEDFPKLITSMRTGIERIRQISISLRTFSRKDTEKKSAFNLHEGIESTLLILKYRLKANEKRPEIQIIKEYGDLPEIKCYPGQLNQVFMNLLANAIDALEESREGLSFPEIEANPQQIHIKTEVKEQEAILRISDNGKGMSQEVQARIFEQGFTTKGVGKGTGLGMAIARQILEEKHEGTIVCLSELGKRTTFIISLPLG